MDENEKEQQLIETRRAEAMALFTSAQAYNARNDQLVGLGLTAIAAAATLALKEDVEEVLLGVPAALMLLITYALQVDADVRVMGVARKRIEEVLERQLGESALIYQSETIPFRRDSFIRGVNWARNLLVLPLLGTAVAGCVVAYDIHGWVLAVLYALLLVAFAASPVLAFLDSRRAEIKAEDALKAWPRRVQ
jgi:hypothetical protein